MNDLASDDDTIPRAPNRRLRHVLGVLLACTALGLATAGNMLTWYNLHRPGLLDPDDAILTGLLDWYLWGLLYVPALAWVRRHPLAWRAPLRSLAWHLPAAVTASLAQLLLFSVASSLLRGQLDRVEWFFDGFTTAALRMFQPGLAIYALFAVALSALDDRRRLDAERLRVARLDRSLANARLSLLQSHLQPHFLFNALNAIGALVHSDPERAERMIARLGDLLRRTLRGQGTHETSLAEELDLLEVYLDLERERFGERLVVRVSTEPEALPVRVPAMILQPLVENAIRHGVASRRGPGRVEIDARRDGEGLSLSVTDDGPGPRAVAAESTRGLGLANTRARLRELYGERAVVELSEHPPGGALARIVVPWNTTPAEPPA